MGGAEAALEVVDSVMQMRHTINALTPADNGRFINYDGTPIDW